MGSLEIPNWVGPAITPIVLLLLIAILLWYYCYWKPKKDREKQGKSSDIEKNSGTPKNHSSQWKQRRPYHDYVAEGTDYYNYDATPPVVPYGQFYPDICHLSMSNTLSYCIPQEYKPPKIFQHPRNPSRDVHPCKKVCMSECQGYVKKKNCKVRCPKGESMKCSELPVIMEGDSLIEEEEDQKFLESNLETKQCSCDMNDLGSTTEELENEELLDSCKTRNENSSDNNCRDSGYED